MSAFRGIWYGFGTLEVVREPSDPVLGLMGHFPVKCGPEKTIFAAFAGFRQFLAASRQDFTVDGGIFTDLPAFLAAEGDASADNRDMPLRRKVVHRDGHDLL